ncbi:hypothetical protein DEO72_LG11g1515 [Vigna unguiculata]|uniref:Uncharacterized protein n=1 Tax=Vigna unguiculata TaxID=3917 RepID=A0A4D6M058_VIGUN|nr:hypothetical protein DEO72_LG5g1681 [Vigna unguiculata]QCE14514.1 hypothetical protein DEO72_LG11g1515 [Vigna unguiculata]
MVTRVSLFVVVQLSNLFQTTFVWLVGAPGVHIYPSFLVSHSFAKQTKLDYAITIQTLLALQDQGLTTLPKKTWADIVSDEEQEGENLDLAFLIKNLKNHKTICNPRMSQELQT